MKPADDIWCAIEPGGRIDAMKTTTKKLVGYWITTAFVAFSMLSGGIGDLVQAGPVREGMAELGYPAYVMTILGIWKLLGFAAILAPGLPRLKEWAYAGIVFDFTGAALSHAFAGAPGSKLIAPLVLMGFAVASWALRPASRRLASPVSAPAERRSPVITAHDVAAQPA